MSPDGFFTEEDAVKIRISGDDDEEELKAHGKGLVTGQVPEDKEKPSWLNTLKRYFCTNCRKGIHNTPDNDMRCKRKGCECKCQTHYIGRDGRARPYGTPDDSVIDNKPLPTTPEGDQYVEELMEKWRKINPEPPKKDEKKETIL